MFVGSYLSPYFGHTSWQSVSLTLWRTGNLTANVIEFTIIRFKYNTLEIPELLRPGLLHFTILCQIFEKIRLKTLLKLLKNTRKFLCYICWSFFNSPRVTTRDGHAVEPQPEPQGKKTQPHARNRKILNRTHGTAKISTARTEPHFSRFNHNRKNTNSEK